MEEKFNYQSFINAFACIIHFVRNERNGRIQFIIGIFVIILSGLLNITKTEWIIVLICIGVVLCAEILNSAIEKLCNYIQPLFNLQIKIIKDTAAGAVLIVSIISALIGVIIFFPKILKLL